MSRFYLVARFCLIGVGCATSYQLHQVPALRASSGRHGQLASAAVTHRRPRPCAHRSEAATDEDVELDEGGGIGNGEADEANGSDDGWTVNRYGERVRREPDPRQR